MKRYCILLATVCLTACATSGTKFEMSDANAMRPGVTTYQDAVGKLGKPNGMRMAPDGSRSVLWSWAQVDLFTQGQARAVRILFDKDSRMIRVQGKAGDQID